MEGPLTNTKVTLDISQAFGKLRKNSDAEEWLGKPFAQTPVGSSPFFSRLRSAGFSKSFFWLPCLNLQGLFLAHF